MNTKPISNVLLPIKPGYIEVLCEDGHRTYRNRSTGMLIENEEPEATADELMDILLGVENDG